VAKDWLDPGTRPVNEYGSKVQIGKTGNVKNKQYSDWRRTLGDGCYANDIDWLEWRQGPDGLPRFVALIETTFYEDKPELRDKLENYCNAALNRFKRDGQFGVTKRVSEALGVPAFFVIARYDLEVFYVCRLSDEIWACFDEPLYRQWIKTMR